MNDIVNIAEALNKSTVIVDCKRGPSTTTETLTGEPGAVREAVARRFREYPEWGYGTTVRYNETGAVVTRSNSCD